MLAKAEATASRLSTLLFWLAGLSVAVMMLHITADILGKTLFHAPIQGTLEITTFYYMPIAALAPLAVVQRDRAHIFVELFSHVLGPRANAALDALMCVLTVVFFGLIAWYSGSEALQKTLRDDYVYVVFFDLKTWPTRWIVPLTSVLVVVTAALQAVAHAGAALRGPDGRG